MVSETKVGIDEFISRIHRQIWPTSKASPDIRGTFSTFLHDPPLKSLWASVPLKRRRASYARRRCPWTFCAIRAPRRGFHSPLEAG